MEQFTGLAENTRTFCSVICQAFEDLSLQQLLTATCSIFVVTLFIICAVYHVRIIIIIIIIIILLTFQIE